MLRKLTNIFNQNQSSKLLDFAEVNSSNSDINFTYIEELRKVVQPASINQLIKELEIHSFPTRRSSDLKSVV